MGQLLREFTRLTQEHRLWWQDDPKDFIRLFLDGKDQILPSQLSEFGRAWAGELSSEEKNDEEFLRNILGVIPERTPGELIFIMGYLRPGEDDSHMTVLGPVLFPDSQALQDFIGDVREDSFSKLNVTLGEKLNLKGSKEGFEATAAGLPELHIKLLTMARLRGGIPLEEQYSGVGYLPHVTNDGHGLRGGDRFTVKNLSVSLHPGARVNIPQAYELASIRLS